MGMQGIDCCTCLSILKMKTAYELRDLLEGEQPLKNWFTRTLGLLSRLIASQGLQEYPGLEERKDRHY